MSREQAGADEDQRMAAGRIAAVLGLALLAGVPVAAGIAAGIPADIADLRPAGVLVVLAAGGVLGAVAIGYRDPSGGARTTTTVRVLEGLAIVAVSRLAWLVGRSGDEAAAALATWASRPVAAVDLELAVLVAVAAAGWGGTLTTLRDLAAAEGGRRTRVAGDPLERMTRRFLLTTVAVATGLGLAVRADTLAGVATITAFAFLVLAVGAISRVRLAALLSRWDEVRTTVTPGVVGRWRRSGGLLIAAAAGVALLLPTPAGIGVVGLVAAVVRAIARGFAAAFDLITRIERPPEEPVAPEWDWTGWDPFGDGQWRGPRELLPPGLLPSWLEAVIPYLIVAVVGALIFVLLVRVADTGEATGAGPGRAEPGLLSRLASALRPRRLFAWLRRWIPRRPLEGLWHRLVGASGSAARRRVAAPGAGTERAPPRRPDHGPRQRILAAYTDVLDAAAERGVSRRPSQTPYEFEAELARVLRHHRRPLDRLTERFVEARFSEHPVDERAAADAIAEAERVRDALLVGADPGGPDDGGAAAGSGQDSSSGSASSPSSA